MVVWIRSENISCPLLYVGWWPYWKGLKGGREGSSGVVCPLNGVVAISELSSEAHCVAMATVSTVW